MKNLAELQEIVEIVEEILCDSDEAEAETYSYIDDACLVDLSKDEKKKLCSMFVEGMKDNEYITYYAFTKLAKLCGVAIEIKLS